MRRFGPETQNAGSADNHEENRLIGDGRRLAFNCRWEFFFRADRRYQHRFGAAIILICTFRAIGSFLLLRPHNMAKTARPLTVSGLVMSVAREFDEPNRHAATVDVLITRASALGGMGSGIPMPVRLISPQQLQPAIIHSFFPSI